MLVSALTPPFPRSPQKCKVYPLGTSIWMWDQQVIHSGWVTVSREEGQGVMWCIAVALGGPGLSYHMV